MARSRRRTSPKERTRKRRSTMRSREQKRVDPGAHGSWAGRGFRYQDAVTAHLALLVGAGELEGSRVVPEAEDDVSIRGDDGGWLLQVKSRRATAAPPTARTIADYLDDLWATHTARLAGDDQLSCGLVLERIPDGWIATGWAQRLTDLPDQARLLIDASTNPNAAELLARTVVIQVPNLTSTSLQIIERHTGLLPQACTPHLHALIIRSGDLASSNGDLPVDAREGITPGDLRRLLDGVSARIDPSAIQEALSRGLCEYVDFGAPLEEDDFYRGVDVLPGHVTAGLVVSPGSLLTEACIAVSQPQPVLITGPSGSGKSALAWLTVRATADRILWFRASRLRDDDTPAVIRLLGAASAGPDHRVGLIADDLGRPHTAGWDRLVRDVSHLLHVSLVGVVRNEDLLVLEAASRATHVRAALTRDLADTLWRRLRDAGQTSWLGWEEPFERAQELVLEYAHILTAGNRLEQTIREQVAARMRDPARAVELRLLRLVATAHSCGVPTPIRVLTSALEVDEEAVRAAAARCVDEHLIRAADSDHFEGLHELRSHALATATHDPPPPLLADTIRGIVIRSCTAQYLPTLVARAVRSGLIDIDAVCDALVERIAADMSVKTLAGSLNGLRVLGVHEHGSRWNAEMGALGLPVAYRDLAAGLALTASEVPAALREDVRQAVDILRRTRPGDRRSDLLARVVPTATDSSAVWQGTWSLADATDLFTSLAGTDRADVVDPALQSLGERSALASPDDAAAVMEAAYHLDPALAIGILEASGGENAAVGRIALATPWLRDVNLSRTDNGERRVSANYAWISDRIHPAVRETVVRTVHRLLSLLPTIGTAAVTAKDATGEPAGYGGMALAQLQFVRDRPPDAWTVARNRELLAATYIEMSDGTATTHVAAERAICTAAAATIDELAKIYLQRLTGSKSTTMRLEFLTAELTTLAEQCPPAAPADSITATEEGAAPSHDKVITLGVLIATNLAPRMLDPTASAAALAGFVGRNLAETAVQVAETGRWSLIPDVDDNPARDVLNRLADLHAVLACRAADATGSRLLLSRTLRGVPSGRILPAAAHAARNHAIERLHRLGNDTQSALGHAGFTAIVLTRDISTSRPGEWPPDVLVLLTSGSIREFYESIPTVRDACRAVLPEHASFRLAPVCNGSIVTTECKRIITDVFPNGWDDTWNGWPRLPSQLSQPLTAAWDEFTGCAIEVSGLIVTTAFDSQAPEEAAARAAAIAGLEGAVTTLTDLLGEAEPPHAELLSVARRLASRLHDEEQAPDATPSLAAELLAPMHQRTTPLSDELAAYHLLAVECDVEVAGAVDRVLAVPLVAAPQAVPEVE